MSNNNLLTFQVTYGPESNRMTEKPRLLIDCNNTEKSLVLSKYVNGKYKSDILLAAVSYITSDQELWDLAKKNLSANAADEPWLLNCVIA